MVVKLLLNTVRPYKLLVAATLAALLLDVAGTLYVPTMLAGMINQGVASGGTDFILGQGLKMLLACCCASGGALLGNYLCGPVSPHTWAATSVTPCMRLRSRFRVVTSRSSARAR